ncbi:hypothetical protein GF380_02730 [Candidatus Uhrbacteria bacterium]|nr:hypothetical protein [Candidatus Uhrbacteria bacterium]
MAIVTINQAVAFELPDSALPELIENLHELIEFYAGDEEKESKFYTSEFDGATMTLVPWDDISDGIAMRQEIMSADELRRGWKVRGK